jgi:hypothetical protein
MDPAREMLSKKSTSIRKRTEYYSRILVSQSASILGTLCAVALEKYNGAGEDRK